MLYIYIEMGPRVTYVPSLQENMKQDAENFIKS